MSLRNMQKGKSNSMKVVSTFQNIQRIKDKIWIHTMQDYLMGFNLSFRFDINKIGLLLG